MKNLAIRKAAKAAKVPLWMIAEALGIKDSSFSRKLRRELHQVEQDRIQDIIRRVSARGGRAHEGKPDHQASSAHAKACPGGR